MEFATKVQILLAISKYFGKINYKYHHFVTK